MNQVKKKILFLTSEIAPFSTTYQLADFSKKFSTLINDSEEFDIRISQPKYGFISDRKYILREVIRLKEVPVVFKGVERITSIKSAFIPNTRVQVYFLIDQKYFSDTNPLIYKSKNGQFLKNNFEKYSLFCASLLESFKKLFWYPDIIICNDWQTALLPILLKEKYNQDEKYKNIKTVNFIHSINSNGNLPENVFEHFDLDINYKKNMNILFESMRFFDLNILLDSKDKSNLSAINKNKTWASNYKKAKSKSIIYPDDKDSWSKALDKISKSISKL